jgi:GH18 family chitinase
MSPFPTRIDPAIATSAKKGRESMILRLSVPVPLSPSASKNVTSSPLYRLLQRALLAALVVVGSRGTVVGETRSSVQPFRVVSYMPYYACQRMKNRDGLGDKWLEAIRLEGVNCLILIGALETTPEGNIRTARKRLTRDTRISDRQALSREDFVAIRNYVHSRKKQFGVAFSGGGWMNGGTLGQVADNLTSSRTFARALLEVCKDYKIDAVDFDWEFPASKKEEEDFGRLLTIVRQGLGPEGIPISVCVSGANGKNKTHINDPAIRAVNYVHLMGYLSSSHTPLESTEINVDYWLKERKCPPEKLLIGLPFFGRCTGAATKKQPKHRPYSWLFKEYHPGANVDSVEGYRYNGPETISKKVQFAWAEKLGGVMVWECSQDISTTEPDAGSLQNAIYRTVARLRQQSKP